VSRCTPFYSHEWLERAFGVAIHNADRIHPEWQTRVVGDTVYATQPSYCGGKPGAVGMLGFVFSPFNVFVFEPAHFIMQREMLRGIRDPAERSM
jgi:hypothetical protein